jgi:hypothetical protein
MGPPGPTGASPPALQTASKLSVDAVRRFGSMSTATLITSCDVDAYRASRTRRLPPASWRGLPTWVWQTMPAWRPSADRGAEQPGHRTGGLRYPRRR